MNILTATEKLVLEKLDLLKLTERRTTTSDHSDTCTADDSIQRHCSPPSPLASYSRGRDDSRDSGKRREEDITAGVSRSRRKRTQSGKGDFTMPCDSSQLDTSCVNTSKGLCTSKYFSSPEDCNDVDISFS